MSGAPRIEIDSPPPDPLRVGGGTAFFVFGTYSPPTVRRIELDLGGAGTPATLKGARFWAIVPVPATGTSGSAPLRARARLRDGGSAELELATVNLEAEASAPPAPADDGLIAICMATYEPHPELLRRQLDSIREQTHAHWECVISDDASSEASRTAIRGLIAGDPRFTLIENDGRLGFYGNFDRALRHAPPEAAFVALADQDDRWHPDKLETLLSAIGDAKAAYSDARIVSADGTVISPTYWSERPNRTDDLISLLLANTVTGAAALYRRETVDLALPFPPALGRSFHDHWLALVARATGPIAYVDRPLYDYVQHQGAELGHEGAHAWARGRRSLVARLRHFRRDREYFLDHWRTTYFTEYCRAAVMAEVLLLRAQGLSRGERRRLERLRDADGSLAAAAWLGARRLRRTAGSDETLGAEGRLLRALAWRRLRDYI